MAYSCRSQGAYYLRVREREVNTQNGWNFPHTHTLKEQVGISPSSFLQRKLMREINEHNNIWCPPNTLRKFSQSVLNQQGKHHCGGNKQSAKIFLPGLLVLAPHGSFSLPFFGVLSFYNVGQNFITQILNRSQDCFFGITTNYSCSWGYSTVPHLST